MTERDVVRATAAEIAPQLDAALNDYLASDMLLGSAEYIRLFNVLWDNKVGILRVLQGRAHGESDD